MKKKRSEKQYLRDIENMYTRKANQLKLKGETPPESFETFLNKIRTRSKLSGEDLKSVAKKALNAVDYTSYEERVHKNVVGILKEEGMYSRVYRMGGSTAFESTKYIPEKMERNIGVKSYHSSGAYMFGTLKVIIWTEDEGSENQFIEFIPMVGQSWLQARYGKGV